MKYHPHPSQHSLPGAGPLGREKGRRPETYRGTAGHRARARRGATTVFGVCLISSLIVVMAMTLDLSHISIARSEMRRAADAAALSAAWQLFDDRVDNKSHAETSSSVYQAASSIAAQNSIATDAPALGAFGQDVQLGTWRQSQPGVLDTSDPSRFNAVRVTLRREDQLNGKVPLFFAKALGVNGQSLRVSATAAMYSTIRGFHMPPSSSETLDILPIALDLPTWEKVLAGQTEDKFRANGQSVSGGSDGLHECNLYPQGTGSPGNRGTVDIGGRNNSTADLSRQIIHGISRQDFIDLGKPFEFDSNGRMYLNGDTGISAGIKDELASIIGQTRIIPIYEAVHGNGNNAMYTIVRLEGVRILDVKLTGAKNQKRVIIQPATVLARGAIADEAGGVASQYLFTPVMLVQ